MIRNIYHPEIEGTEICAKEILNTAIIKSVTYNKNISVLRIKGAGVGYKPGVISEIGASIMVGGNIKGYSRVLTTATVMETGKGNFDIAIALGIILLLVAFTINALLTQIQQRQHPR